MANCIVSGTFTDAQGTAISGATLRFNLDTPALDPTNTGNLLLPYEITTTTSNAGAWTLSIIQGVSGVLTMDLVPTTMSPVVKYKFSLLIPATSNSTFASCWVDSSTFSGSTTNPSLSFANIAGQVGLTQLPNLADGAIWVGNSSQQATGRVPSGDATMSDTGVFTLATVATPGTYPKVTVNAKGLVTAGTVLVSGDIPNNAANTSGSSASCTGNAATVTTNANLTGPITSSGNATSVASQTGTGSVFVMSSGPSLVTPNIGVASGTSLAVTGQLTSTVATGTAPLVVSSTTQVANLNAATAGTATSATSATTATTATNLAGGSGGTIPYQSAAGTTAMLANGTAGYLLQANGTTVAPSWAPPATSTPPGTYYWSGYYPASGSNEWTTTNTGGFVDFTVIGTIPSPTVLNQSGFTVSKATSSLPGINFSAPRTGVLKIMVHGTIIPGLNAAATQAYLQFHESTTPTILDSTQWYITANNVQQKNEQFTLVGYFPTTASTTYNFKLQGYITSGTFYVGGYTAAGTSMLTYAMEYIS